MPHRSRSFRKLAVITGLVAVVGLVLGLVIARRPWQMIVDVDVIRVGPERDATDVPLDAPILIAFSQPVIPAATLAATAEDLRQDASLPQPLALADSAAPATAIPGTGRWLTPMLYSFYPDAGLRAATTYIVTLHDSPALAERARVNGPRSWSFTTESQLLVSTRPYAGAIDVELDRRVEVYLAPDVDPASAGERFALVVLGQDEPVAGKVELIDGGFAFVPTAPLVPGTTYEARLGPGIRTRLGRPLTYAEPAWRFTTIPDLAVARVSPPAGQNDVALDEHIRVSFTRPVVTLAGSTAGLPQPLTITPALPGVGHWESSDTFVYSPTVALKPGTHYQARIAAGLQAPDGGILRNDYAWEFESRQFTVTAIAWTGGSATTDLPSDAEFEAVFSLPPNLDSLRSALRMLRLDTGAEVAGSVTVDGVKARFSPFVRLERGRRYVLTVGPDLLTAGSDTRLLRPLSKTFDILPPPRLEESSPRDGARDVTPGLIDTGGAGLRLEFNVKMDMQSVQDALLIEPPPAGGFTARVNFAALEIIVDADFLPEQEYRVTLGGAAHDADRVPLGQDITINFRTGPVAPAVQIITALPSDAPRPAHEPARVALAQNELVGAYSAYQPARVAVRHVNISQVSYMVYRAEQAQAIQLINGGLSRSFQPDPAALVRQDTIGLAVPPDRQWLNTLNLGQFEPGIYALFIRGPGGTGDFQMMVVSPYALTIKRSRDQLFVWAVDLASGRPVADLPLTLSYSDGGAIVARALGRTGADGVLQTPIASLSLNMSGGIPLFVSSSPGQDFAFASTTWNWDINAASFSDTVGSSPNEVVGNVYTDRPLYQPGQIVQIRGAVRFDQERVYVLPQPGRVLRLTVLDPRGNTILSTGAPLNATGSFSASLELERLAASGDYTIFGMLEGEPEPAAYEARLGRIRARIPGHHFYGTFVVAEYRKPSFEVRISPDTADLLPDETGEFTITAKYFSGEPVSNAPVRWYVLEAPYEFSSASAPAFRFGVETARSYIGPQFAQQNYGRTDSRGQLRIDLLPYARGASRRVALHVEVTDIAGKIVNYGQALVNVHNGAFYIGLNPDRVVGRAGEPRTVDLAVVDPADRSVANRPIRVNILRREWASRQVQGSEGRFYWTSSASDLPIATYDVTTDQTGHASVSFTPTEGGTYSVVAVSGDQQPPAISASTLIYAQGDNVFWGIDNTNQITLVADRARYQPGDLAQILVPAPYPDMTALLTIERGKVIEHRTLVITGTTGLLAVPISADYTPNIYVSVVLVKAANADFATPELRVGTISLEVPIEDQELKIAVIADKMNAAPRDSMTFDIQVTNHRGQGVPTELALALVDDKLLSLAYQKLARDPTPTYTQEFFGRRRLGVETSNTLVQLVDRVTLRVQPGSKGGGGAQPAEPNIVDDLLLRRNFPDTAYWNPSFMTDDQGHARITVTLPDSLTTWTLVVRGLTTDTRFGQQILRVAVSKPLYIEPILPAVLLVGDRAVIRARISNAGESAIEVAATLNAAGLELTGDASQSVRVPAKDSAEALWEVRAATPGMAKLDFRVEGAGQRDGISQMLAIRRYAPPDVLLSSGQVQEAGDHTIDLRAATIPGATHELILDVTPSLAAAINGAVQAAGQPADNSVEQTVSAFLPPLVAQRLTPDSVTGQQEAFSAGLSVRLQRLYRQQNLDGGWGWWGEDILSHPYLSAYATQGLLEARKAGYAIDQQVLERALTYLELSLNDFTLDLDSAETWRVNARSYALFVLSEAGRTDLSATVALYDARDRLDVDGKAYLLLTLDQLGSEVERARTLAEELTQIAMPRGDGVFWSESAPDAQTMSSATRTTALVVLALVRVDPQNPVLPAAVRALVGRRGGARWATSQETAVAVMALAEYLAKTGDEATSYSYSVMLDRRTLAEGQISGANATLPVTASLDMAALGNRATADLAVQQRTDLFSRGRPHLYYNLRVRAYEDVRTLQPLDRGLAIERSYLALDPITLQPTNALAHEVNLNDLVLVRLKLTVPEPAQFLVIEDLLPAGLVPLDVVASSNRPLMRSPLPDPSLAEPDRSYFSNGTFYPDRVVLSVTSIQRGTYYYTYLARATTVGTFQAAPATASLAYAPATYGRSAGAELIVRDVAGITRDDPATVRGGP